MTFAAASRLPTRVLCVLAAAVLLLAVPVSGHAQESTVLRTPQDYERYALDHHPALAAHREARQAYLREADAARARIPQPHLSYEAEIGRFGGPSRGVGHMFMLSQAIPWPGSLAAQAAPAEIGARGEGERFDARALELVGEVRRVLIAIARIDAQLELLEVQRGVYAGAIELVSAAMETGRGDFGGILQLQMAAEMLADRQDVLRSEREQQLTSLRARIGAGPDVTLATDGLSSLLEVPEGLPERDGLVQAARERHPELRAMEADAEQARAMGKAAEAERRPWPMVGLGYSTMPGMGGVDERDDSLLVELSIPIPLFGRQYAAEVERFEHTARAAHAGRDAIERELVAQIDASLARMGEQLARLERYRRELVPLSADMSEHMLHDIEIGRRSVTDYLLAIQQQLDLDTTILEMRAILASERARLDTLTAGALEAGTARALQTTTIDDAANGGDR